MDEERSSSLVDQFMALGRGNIGHGPDNPTSPDHRFDALIDLALERYPFVALDTAFMHFIRNHLEASVRIAETNRVVTIGLFANFQLSDQGEDVEPGEENFLFANITCAGTTPGIPLRTQAFAFRAGTAQQSRIVAQILGGNSAMDGEFAFPVVSTTGSLLSSNEKVS